MPYIPTEYELQKVRYRALKRLRRKKGEPWPDECVEWPGACNSKGYAIMGLFIRGKGRNFRVIRAMKLCPEGKVVDHLCSNPRCVNADHLEVVSQKENIQRSVAKGDHSSVRRGKKT